MQTIELKGLEPAIVQALTIIIGAAGALVVAVLMLAIRYINSKVEAQKYGKNSQIAADAVAFVEEDSRARKAKGETISSETKLQDAVDMTIEKTGLDMTEATRFVTTAVGRTPGVGATAKPDIVNAVVDIAKVAAEVKTFLRQSEG